MYVINTRATKKRKLKRGIVDQPIVEIKPELYIIN